MAGLNSESAEVRGNKDFDRRPVPDPTVLTTEAANRQDAAVRTVIRSEIDHLSNLLDSKFERLDERFTLQETRVGEQKKDTAEYLMGQLVNLQQIYTADFATVNQRFADNEVLLTEKFKFVYDSFTQLALRTAEQKSDTNTSLTAALAAQEKSAAATTLSSEKSIDKSEEATLERIRATENLLSSSSKANDDKYGDLKERLVAIEARTAGIGEGTTGARQHTESNRGLLSVLAATVIAVIAIITLVVTLTVSHSTPSPAASTLPTTPVTIPNTATNLPACADVVVGQQCVQVKP